LGRPSTPASGVRKPSLAIEKAPMAPPEDSMVKRNLPSLLVARSRLKLPEGKVPRIVLPIGVSLPPLPMENPETFAEAVFEVKANFPFGVTVTQQVAAPSDEMLEVMGVYFPLDAKE
jgi:hypothetical protein